MPFLRKAPKANKFCSSSVPLIAVFLLISNPFTSVLAQQAGGLTPSGPTVKVVRAIVGAKGEQRNGSYVMTDPRSIFYVPDDREVIVYFEWESGKGNHHCEGMVRGPNGQFASMSSFDYNATQPRFAGYWKVPLSESTTAGAWVFESHVDGEAAGQLSFQVVPGAKPENLAKERVLPTTAEIYKSAVSSSVMIEGLDSTGKSAKRGTGFLLKEGVVTTSFRVVEGVSSVRIVFPDGKEIKTDQLLGWSRRQDWAAIPTGPSSGHPLKFAEEKSWNIGDHCYWIDVKPDGSRIIAGGDIVGLESPSPWGDRINISGLYNRAALGGPLLNEQGQVVGMLGGTLPGTLLTVQGTEIQNSTPDLNLDAIGGIAIGGTLLHASLPTTTTSLSELLAKGEMMPLLTDSHLVLFGLLSDGPKVLSKSGAKKHAPTERNWKVTFQKRDVSAAVILSFSNNESVKTSSTIKLYDIENHVIAAGKPEKLNIGRGEPAERTWGIPLETLVSGIYRVDISVGEAVVWRQYFQVTD